MRTVLPESPFLRSASDESINTTPCSSEQGGESITRTASLLETIDDDRVWESLIQRRGSINPDDPDIDFLGRMLVDPECRRIRRDISLGIHEFSIPVKKLIPKSGGKMRTVYQLDRCEMAVMKVIADRLHEYDGLFCDCLYSFRRNKYVGDAIRRLFSTRNLGSMWGYKADVHDYFNSIPVEPLLRDLRKDLEDDRLYDMLDSILSDDRVRFRGGIVTESKGVMAGLPISAFLANYYLRDVDRAFSDRDCIYMRYADDILILSDSEDGLMQLRAELHDAIGSKGLEMNPKKERFFSPGEPFEFLGFLISGEDIDISPNTVRKIKGRMRRSSRSIRRWMLRKNAPAKGTVRALIRKYNRLFYGSEPGELSWARWYFSTITTVKSLHEIDLYFQECLRYIPTGRHNHKNYEVLPYDVLRSCGYRPLVSEYYSKRFETS